MGLLKKILLFISSLAFIWSCSTPLILKYPEIDQDGILSFGRTAQRNFYYDESITEFLKLIWSAETNGSQPNSSVLVSGNFLIVSDLSGRIYSFDRTSGKLIGYEKYNGAISVAPVINNLRLYFAINEKNEDYTTIIMFDFVNNKILQEDRIHGAVTNEMIRMDDGIVIVTDRGEVIKYTFTLTRTWTAQLKTTVKSNPAANDQLIAVGTMKGELILLDKKDGKTEFRRQFDSPIESGFTFDNQNLYFGDHSGKLYSFDSQSKEINWTYETDSKIIAAPVFDNEKIIIGNLRGKIFGLNKNTGKKIWIADTKGLINTTPLLTNTILVQPDYNKKVHMINPSLGLVIKTYEFDRRVKLTPVLYDGILFLGTDRGQIHAYQTFGMK